MQLLVLNGKHEIKGTWSSSHNILLAGPVPEYNPQWTGPVALAASTPLNLGALVGLCQTLSLPSLFSFLLDLTDSYLNFSGSFSLDLASCSSLAQGLMVVWLVSFPPTTLQCLHFAKSTTSSLNVELPLAFLGPKALLGS